MPQRQRHPGPADWFTPAGVLLLAATIIGFAALFYFYFMGTIFSLPAGSYPVVMWVIPVAIVALVFFFIAARVLEKCGVVIYRRNQIHDESSNEMSSDD
jgi:membrane protein implicated in regulation of membrane protease activity